MTSDTTSKQVESLKQEVESLSTALEQAQQELLLVRRQTSQIVAEAQDRLYWMDKYRIGPDAFENKLYIRLLLRSLSFARRCSGLLRKIFKRNSS